MNKKYEVRVSVSWQSDFYQVFTVNRPSFYIASDDGSLLIYDGEHGSIEETQVRIKDWLAYQVVALHGS